MFKVGDRLRVVTPFIQSGHNIPANTIITIVRGGTGSQVAAQFERRIFPMHTCSGTVPDGNGYWVYRFLLNDHCVLYNNDKPSWIL